MNLTLSRHNVNPCAPCSWVNLIAGICLVTLTNALAGPPVGRGAVEVDRRAMVQVVASPSALAQERLLEAEVPGVQVHRHPITGSPRWIGSPLTFLTGALPQSASRAASTSRVEDQEVVRNFVEKYRDLFGFGAEALDGTRISRDCITEHNGLHSLVWVQQYEGLDIYEAILLGHVTRAGELVNISCQFTAEPAAAAWAYFGGISASPRLSALQALAQACADVGPPVSTEALAEAEEEAQGSEQLQHWHGSYLKGAQRTRLVWVAVDGQTLRLAWEVIFTPRDLGLMYESVVDAETGQVWSRHLLTEDATDISLRVFTKESPTPMLPGYDAPGHDAGPAMVARTLVTLKALDLNASPNGWINDGGMETWGNNVDAHTDLEDNDKPDLPRPHGTGTNGRVFDFTCDLSQDPLSYMKASVVNLFYWCNWMHDRLYQLGFTEGFGNFQTANFGRGGKGGDAVQADALDGGGTFNANFGTPPDGEAPRMQMYIFDGKSPRRDAAFDATIVLHEYGHGLSKRLVGGGTGSWGGEASMMSEGWSDFYAMALLVPTNASLQASYPQGAYVVYCNSNGAGTFEHAGDSYYFGMRRYPYSTNLSVNPLTFKDIRDAQFGPHFGVTRSPLFDWVAPSECHNGGEVWCAILWEVRAMFVAKLGGSAGSDMALRVITDGLKVTPPSPTFTEARDAILQAELVNTGGLYQKDLWKAFAKRGLGDGATSASATIVEGYSVPDTLQVVPLALVHQSFYFGDTLATPLNYNLANYSAASVSWRFLNGSPFIATPASGTLAANATKNVSISLNASAVAALAPGEHTWVLQFSNTVTHVTQDRKYILSVLEPLDVPYVSLDLAGPPGGPFEPENNKKLTFQNQSSHGVPWKAAASDGFTVSPSSGTLAGGASITLTVGADDSANDLSSGGYAGKIYITNLITGKTWAQSAGITVGNNSYLTEIFVRNAVGDTPAHKFDLANTTLTFVPDGSASFYAACSKPATTFPVNPAGGKTLYHAGLYANDVQLTGGKKVWWFGEAQDTFYICSNGYIDFASPWSQYLYHSQSDYWAYKTIAPLFTGYDWETGTISWKQLSDRVAVTWEKMENYNNNGTNSFQIEMFFDGMIRITILEANPDGITVVGISPGDYPSDFYNTDFSGLTDCANLLPKLTLKLPTSVTEGSSGHASVGFAYPRESATTISLMTSDPPEVTMPASVVIPAGATNAPFDITAINHHMLDGTRHAMIYATSPLFTHAAASLQIRDQNTTRLHVQAPLAINEGDGYVQARVYTESPVDAKVSVYFFTEPSGQLEFPNNWPYATIPAGQTSVVFQVRAPENNRIDGTRRISLGAYVANWTSDPVFVRILDNESTNLFLRGGKPVVEGSGQTSNGAEVYISGILTTNLPVTFISSSPQAISIPSRVVILAGHTNAYFDFVVGDNGVIDGAHLVTLTASAPEFGGASASVSILDNDGPPLVFFPSPADEAEDVPLDPVLSWRPKEGELIENGGFEAFLQNWHREDTGAGGWVSADASYNPPGDEGPQPGLAGSRFALSQQYGNGHHSLWQEVALPDSAASIRLSWWQRVHNHGSFASNQYFQVELRDANNGLLQTLYTTYTRDMTNLPSSSDWTNVVADLQPYHGRTVRIAFVEYDALGTMNISLDQVSLVARPPATTFWHVYFGTNPIPGSAEYLGSTTNSTWDPGTLKTNTTYYWKVIAYRGRQSKSGPIWQFTTVDTTNRAPSVELLAPSDFAIYQTPSSVHLSARLLSDSRFITTVDAYADGARLGSMTVGRNAFEYTWTNPVPGEHTVYAMAHNLAGLRATSAVHYVSVRPATGALLSLVPFGSTWRYHDKGENLGISWHAGGRTLFSDASWSRGEAPLGYGRGNERTRIDFGPVESEKYITTYFRSSFTGISNAQSLVLRVLRDDGAAVYLNGHEILRDNLAPTTIYTSLASTDIHGGMENVPVSASLSPTNLARTSNLLAAEVHQSSPASQDMFFDLELSAVVNPAPVVNLTSPVAQNTFLSSDDIPCVAKAADPYGAVAKVEFLADGLSLGIVTNAPYSLSWHQPPGGDHLLSAVVTDDLGATNVSAIVQIHVEVESPQLNAVGNSTGLLLTWPVTGDKYRVEMTSSLVPPIQWVPLTPLTPVLVGNTYQMQIPYAGSGLHFYRLVTP